MSATDHLISDSTLQLPDGRLIGIAISGDKNGFPIFHFHGSGSSRLEASLLAPAALSQGVRLIALDRPGVGRSGSKPGFHLLDWTVDVLAVASQLGVDRFSVEGLSAGGPFALACAFKIPERLVACGLISTTPPGIFMRQAGPAWMRMVWWIGKTFPAFFRAYLRMVVKDAPTSLSTSRRQLERYLPHLSKPDRVLLQDPAIMDGIAAAFAENGRSGQQGERDTAAALMAPWGFTANDIHFERIFLWHGEDDQIMPVAPARLLARALPHCEATFYPGEGHFSLISNHAVDIFSALKD